MESITEAVSYYTVGERESDPGVEHKFDLANADFCIDSSVSLPDSGYLFLYRHGNVLAAFGELLKRFRQQDRRLCEVTVPIPVGHYRPSKADFDTLGIHRVLKVPDRAKAGVLNDIGKRWKVILARHGRAQDGFPRRPTFNPDLLGELLSQSPYDQLRAMIFPLRISVRFGNTYLPFVYCPSSTRKHYDRVFPAHEQSNLFQ